MARPGTLTVRVVSDTKAAEQGLERFTKKVQTTGDKMEGAGRKMTAFATVPVAAAMGLATKAASDLQQAVGGTEAVFGDARDEIDRYAKTAARASGLSEREFREATTSIGGQLKRMTGDVDLAAEQSVELTRVAADLAATYGGTTADAVAALGSAFRGEADPAERFNLNLKIGAVNAKAVEMGLAATTSKVDDNARAQATLALIMEQSADAQGQFARESDSAAGSLQIAKAEMENASAEIGEALLPLVADLAGGVADLAEGFGSLPDPVQKGVLALGGLIAVAGPVLSVGGKIANAWPKVGSALETAGIAALYAKDNIGKLAVGGAALAVAGIAIERSINAWRTEMNEAASDADAFVDSFTATSVRPVQSLDELHDEIMRVGAAAAEMKRRGDEALNPFLKERLRDAEAGLILTRDALLGAESAAAQLQQELGVTADEAARMATNEELMAAATDPATGELDTQAAAAADAAEANEELADAIDGVTDALTANLDPLFAAQDALTAHKEAQDAVKAAQLEALVAQQNLDTAIREHGRESDEAALASLEVAAAQQKVKDANSETARTASDLSTATARLAAEMEAGNVSVEQAEAQLRAWVEQGVLTAEQAYQVSEELRGTASAAADLDGRKVLVRVRADTSAWEAAIADIYRDRGPVRISVGGGGGIPLRHTGGPVQGGHMYLTGGRGREELFVPDESGDVLSPARTRQALAGVTGGVGGGANVTINVNGGDHDAASIARHVAWALA